jgi:hypothetical protein
MNRFPVWLRPLNSGCKVRVDCIKNARWLLDRLSQSFVFKSSEAMNEDEFFPACVFSVAYGSQMCHSVFRKLLSGISEVNLMTEPELSMTKAMEAR